MSPIATRRNEVQLTKLHIVFLVLIALSILLWVTIQEFSIPPPSSKKCLVSYGTYSGSVYAKSPDETLQNKCLVESPWMRLAQHSVKLPNNGKVIDDWLWIDYHDRINVLVEAPDSASGSQPRQKQKFIILEQTKYALNGMSLAVVGGIIEPNEQAAVAAQREVSEELSMTCKGWKALGKFRTDVNRGMGWVHPFLASDCKYTPANNKAGIGHGHDNNENNADLNEVGGRDAEKQHVQIMTLEEVRDAVIDGQFVEVQWSNTVALAMLHLS
mmetsp:Transcript_24105/g.58215  ORF Transcript_24105/g.58215 Transcript_24105/m.58215 type:complete len:271 (+) Transcript_24105:183-995(+)